MSEPSVLDLNVFMMCQTLNPAALREIPAGYHIRTCRPEELELWMGFPFDTEADRTAYVGYMKDYFRQVYAPHGSRFFDVCLFLCDDKDQPVATCFAWTAYGHFTTIHWFKVRKELEGHGLGRALLSEVLRRIPTEKYPVYLHTQAGSFRAIHLYTDFGFSVLTDPVIGTRPSEFEQARDYLRETMGEERFRTLHFAQSDGTFSQAAANDPVIQF